MRVVTKGGREYLRKTDLAPGAAGNPLTREEHVQRFWDCLAFGSAFRADAAVVAKRGAQIVDAVDHLEELGDVRTLISLLLPE
jgi:hypothetical protein